MATSDIYQDPRELARLAAQNRLMRAYETPVWEELFSNRSGMRILDVGCNDGKKTLERFSRPETARVLGLEYHSDLVARAEKNCADSRFLFRACDVEAADFPKRLSELMEESGIEAFDLIHLSFILMHLKEPGRLLQTLSGVLSKSGRLLLVEPDDRDSFISEDPEGLFRTFCRFLKTDPFAGDRGCGRRVFSMLEQMGFRNVRLVQKQITAGQNEPQKKEDLFQMFFSYLPLDMEFLLKQEPEREEYQRCAAWLFAHFDALREQVLQCRQFAIGVSIMTCEKRSEQQEGTDRCA